jgi:hypothetical protein
MEASLVTGIKVYMMDTVKTAAKTQFQRQRDSWRVHLGNSPSSSCAGLGLLGRGGRLLRQREAGLRRALLQLFRRERPGLRR